MAKYLFCVDSDGCAMDTMTYKHEVFFGPIAAEVFDISCREAFLRQWNQINLYSKTRGVNRFIGLVMCLEWADTANIQALVEWTNNTPELSNRALENEIDLNPHQSLKKALEWSNKVNKSIGEAKGLDHPFRQVKEGLAALKKIGKVMIVSSANKEAVMDEWLRHDLISYIDEVACQDKGKKEDIIAQVLRAGWQKEQVLMIGDSPGDLKSAKLNEVAFYPILVNNEETSWEKIRTEVVPNFVANTYKDKEAGFIQQFWNNLESN
ncbi:HAD family hydrolase [Listeria monocytogenes]|nr:HAD family hydrolase [Listeria monocytogenes]